MERWLIEIINNWGYGGIFLLIAIENIFPPVPSEVILTFGGFVTTTSGLTITGVVIAATLGSVIGAVVLYGVGLQLDVERMEKIVDRWGPLLRLTKNDIHKAAAWFDKYGYWSVFLCRFVPLVRSLISIPAGMSNMRFIPFLIFTTAGTFIWNIVLVNLGAQVGESWEEIVGYMEVYSNAAYAILGLLAVVFLISFIKRRKKS